MTWFPSRTGDIVIRFRDGKLRQCTGSKHLTSTTRHARALYRNGINVYWPHPMRKGRALYE